MYTQEEINTELKQIRLKQNIQYLLSKLLPLDVICEEVDFNRFCEIFYDNREESAPRIDAILYNDLFKKLDPYAKNFRNLFSEDLLQVDFIADAVNYIQIQINFVFNELSDVHLKINEPNTAYCAYKNIISYLADINNEIAVLKNKLEQLVAEKTESNNNQNIESQYEIYSENNSETENETNNQDDSDIESDTDSGIDDFMESPEFIPLEEFPALALDSEQYDVESDEFILNLAKAQYPNLENDKKYYDYFLSQIRFYAIHDPENENYPVFLKAYFKLLHDVITKTSYWNSDFISLEAPPTVQQATHSTTSEATTSETFNSVSEDIFAEISKHLELKDVGRFVQGFGKKFYYSTNKSRFFDASVGQQKASLVSDVKTIIENNKLNLDQNKLYTIADNFEEFAAIAGIEIDVNNPKVALYQLYSLSIEAAQLCFLKFHYSEDANIKSLKAFYKLYLSESNAGKECLLCNLFSTLMSEVPESFLRALKIWTNVQISPALMKYVMQLAITSKIKGEKVLSYEEFSLLKSRLTVGVPEGKKIVIKLTDEEALSWLKKTHFENIPKIFNDDSIRFNKKEVLEKFINDYCMRSLRLNIFRCYVFVKDCLTVAISKEFFNKLITSALDEYEPGDNNYLLLEEFLALKSQVQLNDNCSKLILDISEQQLEILIRKIDSRSTGEYLKEIIPILLDDCFQFDKSSVFAELIEDHLVYNNFASAHQMLSILSECKFDLSNLLGPISTWLIKNSEKLFEAFDSKRNFGIENPSEHQYKQFLDAVIQAYKECKTKDSSNLYQALIDLSEQYQQTIESPPQKGPK